MLKQISFILACITLTLAFEHETRAQHIVADPNGIYHILWTKHVVNSITFELQVLTKGYVVFGFSPCGQMTGADIVIGWVMLNGTTYFHDRHALGNLEPIIGVQQNYQFLKGHENDTHTILRFKRMLNTCDEDDIAIKDENITILYSWHTDDPQSIAALPDHDTIVREAKTLHLVEKPIQGNIRTDNVVKWDIHIQNISVPMGSTYLCAVKKMPNFNVQHDLVGFSAHVTPGSESIIHHIIIIECKGNESILEKLLAKPPYNCQGFGILHAPGECLSSPIITWTVGVKELVFPKETGIPVGKKFGGASYFLINVHYNNMENKTGIFDNSSIRFHLSQTPQKNRASTILMINLFAYGQIIPPRQKKFQTTNFLPSRCTQKAFPDTGIHIFAIAPHAHLTARKISVRHFRGEKELKPFGTDEKFEFNIQEYIYLPVPVTILPGDTLVGVCTYSTENKNHTTMGGYSTDDEMCYILLQYYPAINLAASVVSTSPITIAEYFNITYEQNSNIPKFPNGYENQTIEEHMHHYDWSKISEEKIQEMQHLQFYGEKMYLCKGTAKDSNQYSFGYVQFPKNATPYEDNKCSMQVNEDNAVIES